MPRLLVHGTPFPRATVNATHQRACKSCNVVDGSKKLWFVLFWKACILKDKQESESNEN